MIAACRTVREKTLLSLLAYSGLRHEEPRGLSQDFRRGLLDTNDCTSNRLCWNFFSFHPERFQRPSKGQPWLLRERKNPEVPHFKRFLRHLSVSLLPSTRLFARRHPYPVRKGSAAIRRTMAPNSRRVK